jgi:ribosome-associated protein
MSKSKPAAKAAAAVVAEEIKIRAEPIELSQLLKFAGVFDSGGEAKHAIKNGEVTVNGEVETAARKKIAAGATVVCGERTLVVRLFR